VRALGGLGVNLAVARLAAGVDPERPFVYRWVECVGFAA